jgi:thymidine kinase
MPEPSVAQLGCDFRNENFQLYDYLLELTDVMILTVTLKTLDEK